MIEQELSSLTFEAAVAAGFPAPPSVTMSRPRLREHGDWSTNLALELAPGAGQPPRSVAEAIVRHLAPDERVASVEVAGPGFINFHLSSAWLQRVLSEVVERAESFGRAEPRSGERVQVEFVSANPTGPLHLGHGRWAAVGDALAAVLDAAGHTVEREFYVNDFGRQMELFGRSLAARYLEWHGVDAAVPEGGYEGSYVTELAAEIASEVGDRWVEAKDEDRVAFFRDEGERRVLRGQREVLERFGVRFDVWFSERDLHSSGAIDAAIARLRERGVVYEREGALWLRSSELGDDKDRVVVRATGEPTYFAPDAAYLIDKFSRGFDRLIYLWGADHHGYVPRMRAMVQALGFDPASVEFHIGQFVNLLRGGVPVRMSKRTGELVTFEELLEEVGVDAARYLFLRQPVETAIDFDIEVATSQTMDNPVYYVQYAHARIASLLRVAGERGVDRGEFADARIELLEHPSELELLRALSEYPEQVTVAAEQRAPHRVARYAEERLAVAFHRFYTDCPVLTAEGDVARARLWLAWGVRRVLANALEILGVSAPEAMARLDEEEAS